MPGTPRQRSTGRFRVHMQSKPYGQVVPPWRLQSAEGSTPTSVLADVPRTGIARQVYAANVAILSSQRIYDTYMPRGAVPAREQGTLEFNFSFFFHLSVRTAGLAL